jgi:hypothetical protein
MYLTVHTRMMRTFARRRRMRLFQRMHNSLRMNSVF